MKKTFKDRYFDNITVETGKRDIVFSQEADENADDVIIITKETMLKIIDYLKNNL